MHTLTNQTQSRLTIKISHIDKSVESLAEEVAKGLSSQPKTLPPKFFYDQAGSKIFEEICDLPEYYLTRAESEILQTHAPNMAKLFDENMTLVELGSGNAVKTRLIIEAFLNRFEQLHYVPIDISRSILVESARSLLKDYPNLRITGYVSEYGTALKTLKNTNLGGKLILFLGSNIGNFEKAEASHFLQDIYATMTEEDSLLIGVDLAKDKKILEAAYDDSQGVTARFNLNLLTRINRELDGTFDLTKFRHKAVYNDQSNRIEMHLESTTPQQVTLKKLNRVFRFTNGETIHTENSYKYSISRIKALALRSGFELQKSWFDSNAWFSLNLFQPIS